jgi:hypothetical protein
MEIAVAVLMFIAMVDVLRPAPALAPVLWAALLLVGALALAAGTRRRASAEAPVVASSVRVGALHGSIHGALGCIVMAALVLVMIAPTGLSATTTHHAAIAGSASVVTVVIGAGVLAYGAYSVVALRHGALRERIQYAAMGASTLGMAAALLA